jgi:hypothetical protein
MQIRFVREIHASGPFRRSTRMKVQFIWPSFDCPIGLNIGIAYLSGAFKAAGHDTRILHICEWLDYPFDLDRIESDVKAYDPDLIAVGTGFPHYPEMAQTAKRLKDTLGRPIVFGGIHTTLNTQSVMEQNPWIDFGNVGEGDDSLMDLVRALETGGDTTSIPNVWARAGERRGTAEGKRGQGRDGDQSQLLPVCGPRGPRAVPPARGGRRPRARELGHHVRRRRGGDLLRHRL